MSFDLNEYAKEKAREYLENKKLKHFVISWTSSSYKEDDIGRVAYLQICEREVSTDRDFNRWMTRIQITPLEQVIYYDRVKNEFRDGVEVIEEILKKQFTSAVCIELVNPLSTNRGFIAKVLGDIFYVRSGDLITSIVKYTWERGYKYVWLSKNHADDLLIPIDRMNPENIAEVLLELL